jgi:hypothetical protein
VKAEVLKELEPDLEAGKKSIAENRTLKLDNQVKSLFAKAGVRGERADALWKLTADRYDLTADGKPMLKDKPGVEIEKYLADDGEEGVPRVLHRHAVVWWRRAAGERQATATRRSRPTPC